MMLSWALLIAGCGEDSDQGDRDCEATGGHAAHPDEGPHGGLLLELGSAAHMEFVHEVKTRTVTVYLTGGDARSPLPISKQPQLKLVTAQGPLVLSMRSVGGASGKSAQFALTHAALGSEALEGRISIEVNGKLYNPDLEEVHHHEDEKDC
jgi:hypothetical protein